MARWIWTCAMLLALAGCGGNWEVNLGTDPNPSGDGRNGQYTLVAADAREYALTLDFDARTFRLNGNGLDQSGSIGNLAGDSAFFFAPGAVTAVTVNTARFFPLNDNIVGGFRFQDGVLPFIATRSPITRLADAAGVYNVVERSVGPSRTPATTAFQAELTADGQLRTCSDALVPPVAACPPASLTSGTVSVSGDVFSARTADSSFTFRVARIGGDKVLLRASGSTGTARRFWVGVPATTTFAGGTFAGANTDGNFSSLTLTSASHSATITTPSGASMVRSGTAGAVGAGALTGMLSLSTATDGAFFAARSAELALVAAKPDNTTAPGFLEIGKRQ